MNTGFFSNLKWSTNGNAFAQRARRQRRYFCDGNVQANDVLRWNSDGGKVVCNMNLHSCKSLHVDYATLGRSIPRACKTGSPLKRGCNDSKIIGLLHLPQLRQQKMAVKGCRNWHGLTGQADQALGRSQVQVNVETSISAPELMA